MAVKVCGSNKSILQLICKPLFACGYYRIINFGPSQSMKHALSIVLNILKKFFGEYKHLVLLSKYKTAILVILVIKINCLNVNNNIVIAQVIHTQNV